MTLMQAFSRAGITKREGQQLPEFAREIQALTDDDRKWFADRFKVEMGLDVEWEKKKG